MKKIVLIGLLALIFANYSFAQKDVDTKSNKNVDILPNIPVQVQLTTTIDTDEDAKTYSACVASNIFNHDGQLIIKGGTPVIIDVKIEPNRGMGKQAKVDIACISTSAVDGQAVYLNGRLHQEGKNNLGKALGNGIGLGLTIMPLFGFLFFCIQGDEVVLPQGTYIPNVLTATNPPVIEK